MDVNAYGRHIWNDYGRHDYQYSLELKQNLSRDANTEYFWNGK